MTRKSPKFPPEPLAPAVRQAVAAFTVHRIVALTGGEGWI